jgi:predicted transcriptional regulator
MNRETLTVRVEPGTRKALDGLAEAMDRDRSYVVNEALDAYIAEDNATAAGAAIEAP